MTRLATNRDTHLTRAEIAAEALRQFDSHEREPSIRGLAAALHVAPAAIYHHFPSQAAIYQDVVELVWGESAAEFRRLVPEPLAADSAEVLVAAGMASRRAWLMHPRVARYMAATPEANRFVTETLGVMANVFERLDIDGDVAACFHSYCTFMIGAVLFAAARKTADDQLERESDDSPREAFATPHADAAQRHSSAQTRTSIDSVMDLSTVDPAHDERLFELGLRRLIDSFTTPRATPSI